MVFQKDSTLQVSLSSTHTIEMPLSVLGTLPIDMTIVDLKAILQERVSCPIRDVYFAEKKLLDRFTLKHYGIDKNSKLIVSLITT